MCSFWRRWWAGDGMSLEAPSRWEVAEMGVPAYRVLLAEEGGPCVAC